MTDLTPAEQLVTLTALHGDYPMQLLAALDDHTSLPGPMQRQFIATALDPIAAALAQADLFSSGGWDSAHLEDYYGSRVTGDGYAAAEQAADELRAEALSYAQAFLDGTTVAA